MANGMIEIIGARERRRRWGAEEKLRIVAETRERGAFVRGVAARHDVYPSLRHYWRRQVREGRRGVGVGGEICSGAHGGADGGRGVGSSCRARHRGSDRDC
ncbi:MAG: transposase, partial [Methylocella sp.]